MTANDTIENILQQLVTFGPAAGAVTLIWHKGRVLQTAAAGWRDLAARLPMERNTLSQIASMSMPITSVVALTLLEEGRFSLDEPISRWAPEFATMQVLRAKDGPPDSVDPAVRPITFRDLLTHCSGLTYGSVHTDALARAYADAFGGMVAGEQSPDDWIAALAGLPLIDQPGAGFHYSCATDLLGLLLGRMEDMPLGDVMKRRLFEPLGMADTRFVVPVEQRHRCSKMYSLNDRGQLIERAAAGPDNASGADRPQDMLFPSGGQGLWSTADDFLTFARLFVGQGAVDGVRILQPETVRLMTANHLSQSQRASARLFGMPLFIDHGFGLGVSVVEDAAMADPILYGDATGTVCWPAAYGGWWRADPVEQTIMIFLANNVMELSQPEKGIGQSVRGAICQFLSTGWRLISEMSER